MRWVKNTFHLGRDRKDDVTYYPIEDKDVNKAQGWVDDKSLDVDGFDLSEWEWVEKPPADYCLKRIGQLEDQILGLRRLINFFREPLK